MSAPFGPGVSSSSRIWNRRQVARSSIPGWFVAATTTVDGGMRLSCTSSDATTRFISPTSSLSSRSFPMASNSSNRATHSCEPM